MKRPLADILILAVLLGGAAYFALTRDADSPDSATLSGIEVHGIDNWPPRFQKVLTSTAEELEGVISGHSFRLHASARHLPGSVLAQGAQTGRDDQGLTTEARIWVDTAFVDSAEVRIPGILNTVLLHEMVHALGFGGSPKWVGHEGDHCFDGPNAVAAWTAEGGYGDCVPLDRSGKVGSDDAHWDLCVGRELMVPAIGGGPYHLGPLTAGALADLGYTVDSTAVDTSFILGECHRAIAGEPDGGQSVELADDLSYLIAAGDGSAKDSAMVLLATLDSLVREPYTVLALRFVTITYVESLNDFPVGGHLHQSVTHVVRNGGDATDREMALRDVDQIRSHLENVSPIRMCLGAQFYEHASDYDAAVLAGYGVDPCERTIDWRR
ncbi:MAG: hypothetical protein OXH68_15280 [Gammaproteobacteria bacterium]|nr:hypothetical protein [Gammaproteobacteria bacterium]